ncbi:hypothetical protein BACFRA24663_09445 [Bacteroides fragilis]
MIDQNIYDKVKINRKIFIISIIVNINIVLSRIYLDKKIAMFCL